MIFAQTDFRTFQSVQTKRANSTVSLILLTIPICNRNLSLIERFAYFYTVVHSYVLAIVKKKNKEKLLALGQNKLGNGKFYSIRNEHSFS